MNDTSYLNLLFILLLFLTPIITVYLLMVRTYIKLFCKLLFQYILLSFLVISVFTAIYFAILSLDIQHFISNYPNGFKDLSLSIADKNATFNSYTHFTNVNLYDYVGNVRQELLDLFYFSSMTFFTVGYGDITLTGICRIFPIIEAALGVGITGVYISLTISKYLNNTSTTNLITIWLQRGWDVLSIKRVENNFFDIALINSANETKSFIIPRNEEFLNLLRGFQIKWGFEKKIEHDFDYYTKFANYIIHILNNSNNELALKSYKFSIINTQEAVSEFHEFLKNLVEIRYANENNQLDSKDSLVILSAINHFDNLSDRQQD